MRLRKRCLSISPSCKGSKHNLLLLLLECIIVKGNRKCCTLSRDLLSFPNHIRLTLLTISRIITTLLLFLHLLSLELFSVYECSDVLAEGQKVHWNHSHLSGVCICGYFCTKNCTCPNSKLQGFLWTQLDFSASRDWKNISKINNYHHFFQTFS